MIDLSDKWYGLEETVEYLGVTKDTIRNWIRKTAYCSFSEMGQNDE